MKQKLLLFAFTLLSTMLFSQTQNMAFEDFKTTDGTQNFFYKNVVKTDGSGNIYTLGATTTSNSTTDILLSKKNSSGITLWTKQINGSANYHDFGAGLTVTSGGDVYITGAVTNNTTTLAPSLIVVKYNSSGTQQFSSTYSGAGYGALGKDIVVDGSGNSYITGTESNSSGNTDILTICFNSSGSQSWVDTWDYLGLNDGGVKIAYRANKLSVTGAVTISSNNYKISTISFTASTGVRSETITLGSTMTSSVEIVTDMVTDASDNIYLCGATEVSGQGYNYFLAKLTSSLTIAWQQTYNGASNLNDQAKGVKVDASGNVYVTGYSTSSTQGKNIVTIKYNSSGTQQWLQTINSSTNGDDQAFDMEIDNSANLYVSGSIADGINQLDYYTAKYNSSGTKIWEIQSDGHHLNDQATNLALDSLGNVIVTGESETNPGTYEYATYKYIQKDVLIPTDLNNEASNQFLSFTPNLGQLHDASYNQNTNIRFYNTTLSPATFIKENLNSFMFIKSDTSSTDSTYRFDLTFTKSNENAKPYPINPVSFKQNFYTPNISNEGIFNLAANQRLFVPDIYTNIDLHYYSNSNGIKYYFVVKPNGKPEDILLKFLGAKNSYVNSNGKLIVKAPWDSLTFNSPQIYQLNSGATVTVTGNPAWHSLGGGSFDFSLPSYNTSLPLVIMLTRSNNNSSSMQTGAWYTYLGSYGDDSALDVVTDVDNNVFVSGFTTDATLFQPSIGNSIVSGAQDAMVLKFDQDAHLIWSFLYGGSGYEEFKSIAYSNYGSNAPSIYLTGYTTSNVIKAAITPSVNPNDGTHWDNVSSGSSDALIVKIDAGKGKLLYSQYLGGCSGELGISIATDNTRGRVYIAGNTDNYNSTCTPSFPFKNPGGNSYYSSQFGNIGIPSATDIFILTLDLNNFIKYSTYIAGNSDDKVGEIVVNQNTGDFYITGLTTSSLSVRTTGGPYTALNDYKFPLGQYSGGYWQPTKPATAYNGGYISKFNQNYELHWSTLFNGDKSSIGSGLDIANNGDLYATGLSYSTKTSTVNCGVPNDDGFPICNPFQTAAYGVGNTLSSDIYLARFNSSNQMTYSTLYGNDDDEGTTQPKLCVEKNNNVFLTGATFRYSTSNAFPVLQKTGLYYQNTNPGTSNHSKNAYILWFDGTNTRQWASHYGGPDGNESGNSVALFNSSKLYMVGSASTYSLPLSCPPQVGAAPYCKGNNSNSNDAFLARFDMGVFIGIKENLPFNTKNELLIYPNPSNSEINMFFKSRELLDYRVIIYNTLGQAVYNKELGKVIGEQTIKADISSLSNGIYIVNLVSSKDIQSAKIIKQ